MEQSPLAGAENGPAGDEFPCLLCKLKVHCLIDHS